MNDVEVKLFDTYRKLVEMKYSCTTKIDRECQLKDLTMKQIQYLKIIDRHDYITISSLAQEVNNSKPTVTEMIKKFIKLDCVYKEKCDRDGRVSYLMLTDRGQKIARMEENVLKDVIDKIVKRLTEDEIETLIYLIEKAVE